MSFIRSASWAASSSLRARSVAARASTSASFCAAWAACSVALAWACVMARASRSRAIARSGAFSELLRPTPLTLMASIAADSRWKAMRARSRACWTGSEAMSAARPDPASDWRRCTAKDRWISSWAFWAASTDPGVELSGFVSRPIMASGLV